MQLLLIGVSVSVLIVFTLTNPVSSLIDKDLPLRHPLVIHTSLFIQSVGELQSSKGEFDVEYLIRQYWRTNTSACNEYYLKYLPEPQTVAEATGKHITISGRDLKGFWFPSTYVPEAERMQLDSSADRNNVLEIFVSAKNCEFKYRARLDATLSCKMDFRHYPNDMQLCSFRMRAASYSARHVRYVWDNSGVTLAPNAGKLNQYEMSINYSALHAVHDEQDDDVSWLRITVVFERRLSHFLIQIVAPSVLLLGVAYCSCWIKLDSGPGRYLLTILTLLSLITIFNGYKSDLPKSTRILAADVWVFVCMLFIFATIVELTLVAYIDKMRVMKAAAKQYDQETATAPNQSPKKRQKRANSVPVRGTYAGLNCSFKEKQDVVLCLLNGDNNNKTVDSNNSTLIMGSTVSSDDSEIAESNSGNSVKVDDWLEKREAPVDRGYQIDIIFRVLYPLAFAIFNCIYWPLLKTRAMF